MNKVILIGRLGKDPEVKSLDSGKKVASFSMATSEKYKGEEKTEWHNIVVWGKLAEIVEMYVKKGTQVCVEGKLTTRSWDKDGQTKYMTEIVCFNLQMLGGKNQSNEVESDLPF